MGHVGGRILVYWSGPCTAVPGLHVAGSYRRGIMPASRVASYGSDVACIGMIKSAAEPLHTLSDAPVLIYRLVGWAACLCWCAVTYCVAVHEQSTTNSLYALPPPSPAASQPSAANLPRSHPRLRLLAAPKRHTKLAGGDL